MRWIRLLLPLLIGGLVATGAIGQTSYPMITHAYPVAVPRGQTTEVTVEGQQNFLGAYQVLVEGTGVSAEVLPSEPPKATPPQKPTLRSVKLKVKVEPGALPGPREFRVITSHGVSSIGQLVVVDDPVVVESANNNTIAQATSLTVPGVACGKLEAAEDLDFYKLHAEAGQILTVEVFCARIQDKIHDLQRHADPMLTLLDGEGRELAGSDDFYFADGMLTYRVEKTGDLYLQVRESNYAGDPRWVYAVMVTNKPYVSHAFPLAVVPGQTVQVEPVGSAKQVLAKIPLQVPKDLSPGTATFPLEVNGTTTNPVAFLVTSLPVAAEQEPNDTPDRATPLPIPGCANGRIGARRDLDHYRFQAKKGEAIRFEVKARRFGTRLVSGLDASLDILDAKGTVLATGDDISPAIKDALVTFTPPSDGEYVLRVRDLFSKGGDHFVYAVEAEPVAPDFTLRCDCDKALLGPGGSNSWYVHVTRLNGFAGPVDVEVKGLPPGVTVNSLTIPPTMTQGLLVLTASKDATKGASNVQVIGSARLKGPDGTERTLIRTATPNQEIYAPGGGRARFDVTMQTVGVTESLDIEQVEVTPASISLKAGEEVKLSVKLKRRPDFDGPVTLDVKLRHLASTFGDPLPPGVTMEEGKSKTLVGKASEGHIVLKAAANAAPIENVPVSVLANVSVNFVVKISYSSPAIPLTVMKQ